jgi:hypothetical protein
MSLAPEVTDLDYDALFEWNLNMKNS